MLISELFHDGLITISPRFYRDLLRQLSMAAGTRKYSWAERVKLWKWGIKR